MLDVGYVGSKGTDLIVTFGDLNRPIQVVDPRTPGLASLNARRPSALFPRAVTGDKSVGNSIYHSLQVKGERRLGNGLTFLTAYTWSKSISGPNDIGGQVGGGFYIGSVQDIYNLRGERSVSGFDLTQRATATVLYDIPFFKGLHGFGKAALNGWQASTIITAQSGFPTPISSNLDTTGTGVISRPNQIANGNLAADQRTWQKWFNTAAFTQAAFGAFGNLAPDERHPAAGPGEHGLFHFQKGYVHGAPGIRIPRRILQSPEALQSRSANGRHEPQLGDLRFGRRGGAGDCDPRYSARREATLLSGAPPQHGKPSGG